MPMIDDISPDVRHRVKPIVAGVTLVVVICGIIVGVVVWRAYQASQEQKAYNAVMSQADRYVGRGQNVQATALYEQYLKAKHPVANTYQVTVALAYSYEVTNQHDRAIEKLKQAEAMQPKASNSFLHAALANDYATKGDKRQAIAEYRLAISDAKADNDPTSTSKVSLYEQEMEALGGKP